MSIMAASPRSMAPKIDIVLAGRREEGFPSGTLLRLLTEACGALRWVSLPPSARGCEQAAADSC